MESQGPSARPLGFAHPAESFAAADAETFAALLGSSSDVSLIVDADGGVIQDVAFGSADLAKDANRNWLGKRWVDTVTADSRAKIEELLRDTGPGAASRWRQVNCPATSGPDVPIRFSAIRCRPNRQLIVVGRDLRAMASLQQRLAEAQQAMEREYGRIRGAEKRYRLLFQLASEAVLIIDAANLKILEANPAAATLTGVEPKKIVGHGFHGLFEESAGMVIQSFVAALKVAPRVDNVHVKLAASGKALLLSGSLFRQENAAQFLVLLSRVDTETLPLPAEQASLLQAVDAMPDAFVVTDPEHRILTANFAFLDLIQAATLEQARGEMIDRWLGRSSVDMDLMFANLRTHGFVRHFSTVLRGLFGANEDVEVSAVNILGGPKSGVGFTIRSSGWRSAHDQLGGRELPRTVEQFAHLVGRAPLKTLVRETTDLIERLCIEAALQLTHDNRASAAEMLGLSRQGLYAKLRRYGLGDLDDNDATSN